MVDFFKVGKERENVLYLEQAVGFAQNGHSPAKAVSTGLNKQGVEQVRAY